MKYLKVLGLAAMTAMAWTMLVGAGSASATKLYNGSGALTVGAAISGSLETFTSTKVAAEGSGTTITTCGSSTISATITNAGSSTMTVVAPFSYMNLTFSSCTNAVKVDEGSTLEIHHLAGTTNGTVTASTDFELTITAFGTQCVYGFPVTTHLGTLTSGLGGVATMSVSAPLTREVANFLCPASARWTGSYVITSPTQLKVEAS